MCIVCEDDGCEFCPRVPALPTEPTVGATNFAVQEEAAQRLAARILEEARAAKHLQHRGYAPGG